MKNKIKIDYVEKEISDEEINKFKDFDKLLKDKAMISKRRHFHNSLWLTSLLVVSGIALLFFIANEIQKPNFPEAIEAPSTEITLNNQDVKADKTLPEQDLPVIQEIEKKEEVNSTASVENEKSGKKTSDLSIKEGSQSRNAGETQQPKKQLSINETQKNEVANNEFVDAYPKEGFNALYEYFENELKYPEKAVQDKVSGTVLVEFTISPTGAVENIKVIKTVSPEIDQEAIRLISGMPSWMPATFGDEKFSSKQTLPLTFQVK